MSTVHLEEERLLALAGNDRELLAELVNDFSANSLRQIEEMERDPSSVKSVLHQLKGAGGSLGLRSFYEICLELEQRKLPPENWNEFRTHLEDSVSLALDFLRT